MAQLDDVLYDRSDPSRYGAKVIAVDGDSQVVYPLQLEPGLRQIRIVSLGPARGGVQGPKILPLQAQACVRYYVVAQHSCGMCPDWEPRVYHEEPIDGCDPTAQP